MLPNIFYKAQCLGHTPEQISEHFSKHCYGIKNGPERSKLPKHFHKYHNINANLHGNILQNNIKTASTWNILRVIGFSD